MKLNSYLFVCLIISFFTSIGLKGQNYSIGLSSGPTFFTHKIIGQDGYPEGPIHKTRFIAQGDIMLHVSKVFGLKIGIAYEQKGHDRNLYGKIHEFRFNYLSIPIVAELSFGNKIKLKAQAGGTVEYLLKQEWVREIGEGDIRNSNKTDDYDRSNYSALVGIGSEFILSEKISIELGGRYLRGLKTLKGENSFIKFKHIGFATYVGLRYRIGK